MTIISIQNVLFNHFLHSDTLIFSRDLDGLELKSTNDDSDTEATEPKSAKQSLDQDAELDETLFISRNKAALITLALKEMQESGLVKPVTTELDFWLLVRPLNQIAQTVSISAPTADMIAEIVNSYREANNVEGGMISKLAIDEGDINNLCAICLDLLDKEDTE
jgi:hypothetical protein